MKKWKRLRTNGKVNLAGHDKTVVLFLTAWIRLFPVVAVMVLDSWRDKSLSFLVSEYQPEGVIKAAQ